MRNFQFIHTHITTHKILSFYVKVTLFACVFFQGLVYAKEGATPGGVTSGSLSVNNTPLTNLSNSVSEVVNEKVYVDVDRANLRGGAGSQYESVGVVTNKQELVVVSVSDDWVKVSTSNGKLGWVNKKAITQTTPTPVVVRDLKKKIAELELGNKILEKEKRRASDSRQELELTASKLKAEVNLLKGKNEELKSGQTFLWFGLGLAILFIGWGLGFLTGMFRKQAEDKRYDHMIKEAAGKRLS